MSTENPKIADLIRQANIAVVKVGSALIAERKGFSMVGLAEDMKAFDWETILVSSGAVAVGRELVPTLDPAKVEHKHALSAIGQAKLITRWQNAFLEVGGVAAQVLLTPDVTDDRSRYLNARSALRALFAHGVTPVVNENDAVTTRTFRFGDNDRLGAKTASLIDADLLIILSDIDGLYDKNPSKHDDAKHVDFVPYGTADQYLEGAGESGSDVGTGGMRAKLTAARIATDLGVTTVITSGRRAHPLRDLVEGRTQCTIFEAGERLSARKRWLSGVHERTGAVEIDHGAVDALGRGASLLSVGVVSIPIRFGSGEVIEVRYKDQVVAFGLAHVDAEDIDESDAGIVLHRDDMILTMGDDNERS